MTVGPLTIFGVCWLIGLTLIMSFVRNAKDKPGSRRRRRFS